jgi:hypothetical protein
MSQDQDDKLDRILNKLDEQGEEIMKMNRGLYGDPHNKVPGLMQGHYELKTDVDKIKEFKKKATWTFAGLTTAAPFIIAEVRKLLGI